MTAKRIALPGGLAVVSILMLAITTLSAPAAAQEGVHFARQTNWLDISHGACVTRANRSISSVNTTFGLRVPLNIEDGWLIGGNTIEANVTVGCASDNDSLQLDSEYAARVLVLIEVSSRDEQLAMQIRNQMRDCFFSGECSGTVGELTPVFAPEVNVVAPAQDPTTFGRRRGAANAVRVLNWNSHAVDFREQIGTEFTFDCPALGLASFGRVWGTEVYTTDSSICTAAVHSGAITSDGGLVAIQIVDGRSAYDGTAANEVTSIDYGPWNSSFIFVEVPETARRVQQTEPVASPSTPETETESFDLDTEGLGEPSSEDDFGFDLEPTLELGE